MWNICFVSTEFYEHSFVLTELHVHKRMSNPNSLPDPYDPVYPAQPNISSLTSAESLPFRGVRLWDGMQSSTLENWMSLTRKLRLSGSHQDWCKFPELSLRLQQYSIFLIIKLELADNVNSAKWEVCSLLFQICTIFLLSKNRATNYCPYLVGACCISGAILNKCKV